MKTASLPLEASVTISLRHLILPCPGESSHLRRHFNHNIQDEAAAKFNRKIRGSSQSRGIILRESGPPDEQNLSVLRRPGGAVHPAGEPSVPTNGGAARDEEDSSSARTRCCAAGGGGRGQGGGAISKGTR